jgi:hypothetical protein
MSLISPQQPRYGSLFATGTTGQNRYHPVSDVPVQNGKNSGC